MRTFKKLFFFAMLASLFSCQQKVEQTVHLSGQLVELSSGNNVTMSYNGASSELGKLRDIILTTDESGNFDTTFVLTEPGYYNLSRNTIYLSPGDDLVVKITQTNSEAEFSGTSAEINTYMKKRLFPKGGSFLEAGRNIVGDFDATKLLIDSLAAVRQAELDALQTADSKFKELESMRILADQVNSYISFYSYAGYAIRQKGLEFELPERNEFMKNLAPIVAPMFAKLNKAEYLDVAVVRDVFSYYSNDELKELWFAGLEMPTRTKELYEASALSYKLSGAVSQELIDEVTNFANNVANKDFADEMRGKIEAASKLLPGRPAIDIALEDTDGNSYKLSDFKGKVIYLDFWATWCGPCIQESPYFEAMAKQFDGKDVTFLTISTDKGKKEWLNYLAANEKQLKQYHTADPNLGEGWDLKFIPRFILIDKDFNIADAYATRPSQEVTAETIESLLN